jgi:hypothetical protein
MQNILVILQLYWNSMTLVLIWKVLRQAFRSYHYFGNPSTFGRVILLDEMFSKYLHSSKGQGRESYKCTKARFTHKSLLKRFLQIEVSSQIQIHTFIIKLVSDVTFCSCIKTCLSSDESIGDRETGKIDHHGNLVVMTRRIIWKRNEIEWSIISQNSIS